MSTNKKATRILWDYLRPKAEALPGHKLTKLSGADSMERLVERRDDVLPCSFTMRPRYKLFDNGAHQYYAFFDVVLYVLRSAPLDDDEAQDVAYDDCEADVGRLLSQFRADDGQTCLFEAGSVQMEPVSLVTVDAVFGYELRCRLGLPVPGVFA